MAVFTDSERYFYERGRYGSTARLVDLCMAHTDRPCVAHGFCSDSRAWDLICHPSRLVPA